MSFHVYNSLTRQKEAFQSLEPGKVRMYNCGPTVYNRAHIGNFRSYIFADLLRRWLECLDFEVRQVMNITDVGHFTDDDEDEGEDKLEAQARRTNRDPWQISEEYTEEFFRDLERLACLKAGVYPKATDHIAEMLEIVVSLVDKGYAYAVDGNVYFDVHRFERYGRLSGNKIEDLDAGARIAVNEEKRHPADFALWKSDEHHIMKWPSTFGPHGFPGWHIECSAMARRHLGDRIDIHTGGEDNIFPHHECEIAQSESFTGETFASYWMHTKFLQVDGGKMSKSLGNTYTLDDVERRGFSDRALRYSLIRGHYRQPLNFTWEILSDSRSALKTLDDLVHGLQKARDGEACAEEGRAGGELVEEVAADFRAAMNDDLHVPRALASLFRLAPVARERGLGSEAAAAALEFLAFADRALGVLDLSRVQVADDVQPRIEARKAAREAGDYAESDRIRDELLAEGILLEDTPEGTLWRRK